MKERQPPYANVVNQYDDRAKVAGEDISKRMDNVWDMLQSGGAHCVALTLAFTHPDYSDKYNKSLMVPNLLMTLFTTELVELSGEEFEKSHFGKLEDSKLRSFQEHDLRKSLQGANAVWFTNADRAYEDEDEDEGYNHVIGIVPAKDEEKYIVLDTSGYIDPLIPMSINELYVQISQLPVGKEYMQTVFSFRNKTTK